MAPPAEQPDPQPEPCGSELARLLRVIERLRAPGGCPWDRAQTEQSMARHLLEEAFEAVEALQRGEPRAAAEELGDVLMNVVMIAEIAAEAGRYDLEDVARAIADKLERRHPHVFGDAEADGDVHQVLANWEAIKLRERAASGEPPSVLAGLPVALPALLAAFRIGEKAARVGFDWPDAAGPRAKVDEELAEVDRAAASGDRDQVAAELGDLLFATASLARHHGVDPEAALRGTLQRFRARFAHLERALGARLAEAPLAEKEALWQASKRAAD